MENDFTKLTEQEMLEGITKEPKTNLWKKGWATQITKDGDLITVPMNFENEDNNIRTED